MKNTTSIISLATPILPKEKLYPTPSMLDGLLYEHEFDLRLTGCELIQTSGRLLKLPQTAMATAQVLFHRYYYSKSFVKNNMEHYAMAAVFLSSKIEECPRRIRDVMNVFNHIKQVQTGKLIKPMSIDQQYNEMKNQIIKAERRILKELGFCVHVKHPHKIISIYLTAMECNQKDLVQKAWNYMNDSLRTDVFLRYKPEIVACACIYLSARQLKISLPTNPPWFSIFGAQEDTLKIISLRLLHLYSHKKKTQEELEKIVTDLRENLMQEKKRIKETAASQIETIKTNDATPISTLTPKSSQTNLLALAQDQKQQQQIQQPIEINSNNLNIKINIINTNSSHHHHHHHQQQQQQQQQQHQLQQHHHHHYNQNSKYFNNHDLIDQNVIDESYTRNGHQISNGYGAPGSLIHEIRRKETNYFSVKEPSRGHKKHKRRSSKHRKSSQSRSRSRSSSLSPKHKKHKKRSSKERNRTKSKSRSLSPLPKHKKKKEKDNHKSRSKTSSNSRYNLPLYMY